ncbi:MAG: sugar ABC transporter substrate-binding protein [Firmicutes bacterium]|jgi:multiple sugar transport system substrate-binding protein|nr:sugar ABC transporter substrate-binding protein [Bacillota bacterium]
MCRWGRIALVVVLIASFFLNTAPSVSAAVQLTHYTYEAHGDFWRQFLELMAERFKASTGISVEFIVASGSEYRAKLMTMIAGGVPPDVTDAHPMLGAPLIAQGVFEDLTPYVKRDNFPIDQMPPVAVEGVMTPDRKLWGIPGSVYPVVTFFNADLFAEAGIPNPRELGENWTWETLISSARALTRDRDGDGVFETYGTSRISYRWEMQVHQAGGQLYDRVVYPTKSQFNTPEVLRAVEFIRSLYADNIATNNHTTYDVFRGTCGFAVVDGPGSISSYQHVGFRWDIAIQPKGPVSRAARVNPDGFQIVSHSPHKEEAWLWIRQLTGSVESQMELARISGRMPSLREAMIRYTRMTGITMPDNWQALIETAFDPDGYAAYVVPNATEIDAVVNPVMSRIWNGQIAPAVGLQQIHDVLAGLLQ